MPNMKNMKLGMLENIWKMICESSLLCLVEIWGMGTGVSGTGDVLQENVESSRSVVNVAAESEFGIRSRKGYMMEFCYKIGHHQGEWEGGTIKTVLGRAGC